MKTLSDYVGNMFRKRWESILDAWKTKDPEAETATLIRQGRITETEWTTLRENCEEWNRYAQPGDQFDPVTIYENYAKFIIMEHDLAERSRLDHAHESAEWLHLRRAHNILFDIQWARHQWEKEQEQ